MVCQYNAPCSPVLHFLQIIKQVFVAVTPNKATVIKMWQYDRVM